MKKFYTMLFSAIALLAIQARAQVNSGLLTKPVPKPNVTIPFGKKLPPPDLNKFPNHSLPANAGPGMQSAIKQVLQQAKLNHGKINPESLKQTIIQMRKNSVQPTNNSRILSDVVENKSSDFHLTKDIDSLANSYPVNFNLFAELPFATLKNNIYFIADDNIHGNELWRSDGTDAGTYMVKDIVPGEASSYLRDINAAGNKIYFDAEDSNYIEQAWISDGTPGGTFPVTSTNDYSELTNDASEFTQLGNKVYFITDGGNPFIGALWKTDGTKAGTKLIINLGDSANGGSFITQLTRVNNLLFFTLMSNATGAWELWRSDGTDTGTYHIGTNTILSDMPLQLTAYNNRLYFSSDDGSGRKLWLSDGTDAGTHPASGNHDVLLDYNDYSFGPFTVFNNAMYMTGNSQASGNALYKYDATNNTGLSIVKNFISNSGFISRSDMAIVNNSLFFNVTVSNNGSHNELWNTKGNKESTKLVDKFRPDEGIGNLYNANDHLYFDKYDKFFGTELWTLVETPFGGFPVLVQDLYSGSTGSGPYNFTAFKGKLFFSATSNKKGNELFMTNDLGIIYGATLVKDINSISTNGSYAGTNNLMTSLGQDAIFGATDYAHSFELYKSDGTEKGTYLLNDIIPGESESYPGNFLSKNNAVYFFANTTDTSRSIYKTNGTTAGLKKITPDYSYYDDYLSPDYDVANNGILFYVLFDYNTNVYELWRSNGTSAGTHMLSSNVYGADALHVIGNTAFFVAGDANHGYELWKSDGSTSGTVMVKDINPGANGSYPGGLFVYKNEVYFGANDGTGSNNGTGAGFWKSDGTEAGTIKLKNIDPWYGSDAFSTARLFCISNDILYFSALRYSDGKGTELWKTDGTSDGTKMVKDINPTDNSVTPGPYYLTDVNGIAFFTADDGVHGTELWKTNGTYNGTELVKDITIGSGATDLNYLVSYAGKLYFSADDSLWSSDGTENGTMKVDDAVISQVQVYNVVAAKDNLFVSGYTHKYGIELYVGKVADDGKFIASSVNNSSAIKATVNNVLLYPNPAKDVLNVRLGSTNLSKAILQVTNVAGSILINKQVNAFSKQNVLQVNVSQFASGTYFIKLISADGTKTSVAKFEKQ